MKAHKHPTQTCITDVSAYDRLRIYCRNPNDEHTFVLNDDMRDAESHEYLPRNWEFAPSSLFPYRPTMRVPKQRTRLNNLTTPL